MKSQECFEELIEEVEKMEKELGLESNKSKTNKLKEIIKKIFKNKEEIYKENTSKFRNRDRRNHFIL